MPSHAVERIAEDETRPYARVKKRLDAKMIARAEQPLLRPIPNGKGEISDQALQAIFAPGVVGVKDQFDIRAPLNPRPPRRGDLVPEFVPSIDARIGRNPHLAVET